MALHARQKVVCVGGSESRLPAEKRKFWSHWRRYWGVASPAKGSVYTVREVRARSDGTLGIRLVEVVNPVCEWNDAPPQEPWYHATDFRPVVERETDISIFTRMLQPAKKAAETVGFLAFMAGVCIAIEFAQFWGIV